MFVPLLILFYTNGEACGCAPQPGLLLALLTLLGLTTVEGFMIRANASRLAAGTKISAYVVIAGAALFGGARVIPDVVEIL